MKRRNWIFGCCMIWLHLLFSNEAPTNVIKLYNIPGTSIPAKIHQTCRENPLNSVFRLFNNKRYIKAWKQNNLDFEYYFWRYDDVQVFVNEYYPQYYDAFQKLPVPELKSHVFRYMVLNTLGGVYSDSDTILLKPVREWIKPQWACSNIQFIAGIEFDIPFEYGDSWKGFHKSPLQLCQWTMASSPNNDILNILLGQIFSIINNSTVEELRLMDVVDFTGPGRWSRVIFSKWEDAGFSVDDFRGFGDHPKCFSNRLILPITCFNPGLTHGSEYGKMGSKSIYDSDALAKHSYAGSWKSMKIK